jgi:hypothetical protein
MELNLERCAVARDWLILSNEWNIAKGITWRRISSKNMKIICRNKSNRFFVSKISSMAISRYM